MPFAKGGKSHRPVKKPPTKKARTERDSQYNREIRRVAKECPMSEREANGLIAITEEHIRTYVTVAYVVRFHEPLEEEWSEIATLLCNELECDKRTVMKVFERLSEKGEASQGIKASPKSGRPKKLDDDNRGLAAAAMALNSNLSLSVATEICNRTNEKAGVPTVSSSTVIRNLRDYTLVRKQRVLNRKTGSRDESSLWAKARVARVRMTAEMFKLGEDFDNGKITMIDCCAIDIPPAWLDGMVFIDQSHMRAVPAGGNGHAGSMSRHQWRVAVNAETGLLDRNGVLPPRLSQIKPKFDSHSQGCYAVCLPEPGGPVWLPTFDYTGKKMVSAKDADARDYLADKAARKKKGLWSKFDGANPYFDKYSTEQEKNDLVILASSTNWQEVHAVMNHDWYVRRRKATKVASVCEFVLHTIAEATRIYQGTLRQDTFMLWHDRLVILWDKATQKWLRRFKCPIEGWQDRTWADRFIRLRGKYNEGVDSYYQDSLPGDSPELMPLDSHLFSDIKEGVGRNVAFSFFLPADDPDKYSLSTPHRVYSAIERTIKNGCPSNERIAQDIMRIPDTLRRIDAVHGTYIDDNTSSATKRLARHGVRGDKEHGENNIRLSMNTIDPIVQAKFDTMLENMMHGKGVPFAQLKGNSELVEIEETTQGLSTFAEDVTPQD